MRKRKNITVTDIDETLSAKTDRHWFSLSGRGELYLRRSTLELEGEEREGLVIANVFVTEKFRRKGIFSGAVRVVEEAAAQMGLSFVFVEMINNPILIPVLEKQRFTLQHVKNEAIELGPTFNNVVLPAGRDSIHAYKILRVTERKQL